MRSYAYDLLRWWRWLQVFDLGWDKVTASEVREFVLWLQRTTKPQQAARTRSPGPRERLTRSPGSGSPVGRPVRCPALPPR
ncbi:site-specific integrase [Nonomuraea polychroma]|uniref:site-specific integrase n=1 Tax=Nonomuraea polychroma TaxID=46176 RepID=UPI003BAD42B8